jgi:hypothetical protein
MDKEYTNHDFEEYEFKNNNNNKRKLLITNDKNNYHIKKTCRDSTLTKKRKLDDYETHDDICIIYKKPSIFKYVSCRWDKMSIAQDKLKSLGSKEKNNFKKIYEKLNINNNKHLKTLTIKFTNNIVVHNDSLLFEGGITWHHKSYFINDYLNTREMLLKFNFNNLPPLLISIDVDNMNNNLLNHNDFKNIPNTVKKIKIVLNSDIGYKSILFLVKNFINYGPQGAEIFKINNFVVTKCFTNKKNINYSFPRQYIKQTREIINVCYFYDNKINSIINNQTKKK